VSRLPVARGIEEKRKMLPTDFHGLARIEEGECSGLFFLAIEPSSGLAIRQEDEERGAR
jgi:hypothetical protein